MAQSDAFYKPTARALHWLVALLLVATIPAGVIMVQEGLSRGVQDSLYLLHKNVGVLILVLVIVRIIYRTANPPPPMPSVVSPSQRRIAEAVHILLYVLLIVMSVSGYVRVSAGGFPIEMLDAIGVPRLPKSEPVANFAKAVHFWARFALIGLIAAHVGAALYHGIVKKDGVFSRMWPAAARKG